MGIINGTCPVCKGITKANSRYSHITRKTIVTDEYCTFCGYVAPDYNYSSFGVVQDEESESSCSMCHETYCICDER